MSASLSQQEAEPAGKAKTQSKKGKVIAEEKNSKEAEVSVPQNKTSCVLKEIADATQSQATGEVESEVVKTPRGKKIETEEPEVTGHRPRR